MVDESPEKTEKTLLVVHHTSSPATRELLEAVLAGARDPEITGVVVRSVPALHATPVDVLSADGYIFGTSANFGYMSGALKHFFDTVYYPCLDAVAGRPYGLWVHGNNDTAGAAKSVQKITVGLELAQSAQIVEVIGPIDAADRESCYELGATIAVTVAGDL
ncbi:flavodoxin family protein [Rhodococcus xishaensis]|uniref:Flavodoxin family protein n=1 Tax=Rhodococcus xishaensis TaxID=2487364 RepID=A0A438AYY9_9NOCA|nr:flavodoxin family protein [Rhodococcus xishaensis]RVW03899.1 flavodoxin family protein [Rhodococcus xishaensis]